MSLINRYELIYIMQSMWSVRTVKDVIGTDLHQLACPARFERATYALEAVKMRLNNSKNNGISLARSGVAKTPRTLVRSGMPRS
jgi:coenzyme F420-reducing hydrogenase gamma subunit